MRSLLGRKKSRKPGDAAAPDASRDRSVSAALDQGIYNKAAGIRREQRKRSTSKPGTARAPSLDELGRGHISMEGWLSTRSHKHEASVSSSKAWRRCYARLRGTRFEVFDTKPAAAAADAAAAHPRGR